MKICFKSFEKGTYHVENNPSERNCFHRLDTVGSAQDRQPYQFYSKKKAEGEDTYHVETHRYGEDVLNALQLKQIPPYDVTLTPKLLKKRGLFDIP